MWLLYTNAQACDSSASDISWPAIGVLSCPDGKTTGDSVFIYLSLIMLRCGRACARTQTVKEQWSGLASNKLSAVLVHRFKLANQIVNGRLTFHSGVREKILSNRIKIMAFSNDKRHHRAALHQYITGLWRRCTLLDFEIFKMYPRWFWGGKCKN